MIADLKGAGGTWPPDPATIDLSDGTFLLLKEAMRVTRLGERQLRYLSRHPVAIKVGGKLYFHRVRLMTLLCQRLQDSSG